MLETVKEVGHSAVMFLLSAKECAGSNDNSTLFEKLQDDRRKLEGAVNIVIEKLEGSTKGTKDMNKIVDVIHKRMNEIPVDAKTVKYLDGVPGDNYLVYCQTINDSGKAFITLISDIVGKSAKPSNEVLMPLAKEVSKSFVGIASNLQKAASMTKDRKICQDLLNAARDLGGISLKLVEALKSALAVAASQPDNPLDAVSRQKISNTSRELSQAVTKAMSASKEGARGIVICEKVLSQIADFVADIESQLIFAQSGQLDSKDAKETFSKYRDVLQTLAKNLVESTKSFVTSAAAADQEKLADSANATMQTMNNLKEKTKSAVKAISSADQATQEQLLYVTKNVADCLSDLVAAAIESSGKSISISLTGTVTSSSLTEDIGHLKKSAKQMVQAVQEFINAVKSVGDDKSRGVRMLDNAVNEIQAATNRLNDDTPAEGSALPDDVASAAQTLASTTAKLATVASRGDPNDREAIEATKEIKQMLLDLIRASKASADNAPPEKKQEMHDTVGQVSNMVQSMLIKMKEAPTDATSTKEELTRMAKQVADNVTSVVDTANELASAGYVDENDPQHVAERELLAAAGSIEAAARKLAMLQPKEKKDTEELNFEDQIVEAARAIAVATGALLRSATSTQREIVSKRKDMTKSMESLYLTNGAWSEGLVSAAKEVAFATGDLCEAANAAVKGEVRRERVIAAARSVSSSTARLLTSATVKADLKSQNQVRLKAAGKSVLQATEALVKAAEESMAFEETDNVTSLMKGGGGVASQRIQELDAQARVLKMEKELDMARTRLGALRKEKYVQK